MASLNTNGRQRSGGQTERAAALARLLHEECVRLLGLYTERESFPSIPESRAQLVIIPPLTPQLSNAEKICFLHAALEECLRLLEEVIRREDTEFSDGEEDEYKKQRRTVKTRLGHLLISTERLLVDGKTCAATVATVPDSVDSGSFALKKWILQVLQDLEYWSSQTSVTLQSLPEKTKTANRTTRGPRRHRGRLRK
ncbi:ciliary neurotrophic factor [Brachyhypopomus gauderio]|uniref:ciliary neurotrophic factor n=1 Tax=Brachyhypopomus gauderio TaxID=698409 RepID=UPI004042B261